MRKNKILLVSFVILFYCFSIFLCQNMSYVVAQDSEEIFAFQQDGLNINFYPLGLDTGETYDSYIISYKDKQILVDAGAPWNQSSPKSSDIINSNLTKILGDDKILDYVIVTHADSDHLAGFSTPNNNGVFDYCLANDISINTLIDFDITQDETITNPHINEYYAKTSTLGNQTMYGRYCSVRDKIISKGTTYYTASECCWQFRNIDKPETAPNTNLFVLEENVLTLEILYNYYYDHKFNENTKVSSMDRNVLSVCFMLTYKTADSVKTFLFTGDLEEFDSSSGIIAQNYADELTGEADDYLEDIDNDDLIGSDYSVRVYGETKLWEYLISNKRQELLSKNSYFIDYDIKNNGITFYKVAHHGSRTSNSKDFIDNIRPCYAVIPCVAGSYEYTQNQDDQFPAKVVTTRLFQYTDYIYITELATAPIDNNDKKKTSSSIEYYGNIQVNCNNNIINITTSSNNGVLIQDTDWYKTNRYAPLNTYIFNGFESALNSYIGNCTLVKYGHTDILIDCGVYGTIGNNAMLTTCFIDKVKKYCVDNILEYVIISSANTTSLQQMVDLTSTNSSKKGILSLFSVEHLIDYGYIADPTNNAEKSLFKAYNKKKTNLINSGNTEYISAPSNSGKTFSITNNLSITILNNEYYLTDTNYDVCCTINFLDKKLLFTGNITEKAESSLVDNNDLTNIVFYKSSFFGYDGSNSDNLLTAIKNDRLYIAINGVANKNLFDYKILSKNTCDNIINSSAKHFSYLSMQYINGKYQEICGDMTFSLYSKNNDTKYSFKGSNNTQRLYDTEYYRGLK